MVFSLVSGPKLLEGKEGFLLNIRDLLVLVQVCRENSRTPFFFLQKNKKNFSLHSITLLIFSISQDLNGIKDRILPDSFKKRDGILDLITVLQEKKYLYIEYLSDIQETLMRNIKNHTVFPTNFPKKCIYVINSYLLVES